MLSMNCQFRELMGDSPSAGAAALITATLTHRRVVVRRKVVPRRASRHRNAARPILIRLQDDFAGLTWHDALAVSHDRIIGMFHLIASRVFARLIPLYAHHSNETGRVADALSGKTETRTYQARSLISRGSRSGIPRPVPSMAASELCSPDAGSRIEEKSGEIPYRLGDPDVIARKLALSKTS
ncbi:hypothetical protein [Streptomyces sp. RPT161]|uniref:hypothetical protein n=1 Tax=Streptomyces sp. RPT161 TaxID=3015993 RepID=UPI0022B8E631|nr:hypothetical protein [Streptomyces sp. RPT161]